MTTPMNPYAKKPIIRVDNKAMFATIRFPAPAEGESAPQYDVDTLENMLAQEGIVYGIDRNMLSSLCQEILFDTDTRCCGKRAHGRDQWLLRISF